MTREAGSPEAWREYLGVAVTVLSAVLLGLVVWQMTKLGNEAALDRATLAREHVGLVVTDQIMIVPGSTHSAPSASVSRSTLSIPFCKVRTAQSGPTAGCSDAAAASV